MFRDRSPNKVSISEPVRSSYVNIEDCASNVQYEPEEAEEEFWDLTEGDDFLLETILYLFGSSEITFTHAIKITNILKELYKKTTDLWIKRTSKCESVAEVQDILQNTNVFDFTDYLTEHKIKSNLIKRGLYSEPTKFVVEHETVEHVPGLMRNIDHQGVILDVEFQMKSFLELDGVLENIINYQDRLLNLPPGQYENFVNGHFWKKATEKFAGKTCIPLFLYNDDLQIDDKVGPHSSTNTLSSFYYLFPTLPPHIKSKVDSIFGAMIVKAGDIKKYGMDSPLYCLVKRLTELEIRGITVFNGSEKQKVVHIVTSKILGDNLGLHTVCGFRKTFNMPHYCMTCEMSLERCKFSTTIPPSALRTIEKYDQYFENGNFYDFGLEGKSVLNDLPSCHVALNRVKDIMHDLQLGVILFILWFALKYFKKNYRSFNLDTFNHRLRFFDCGEKERKNVPSRILESHLNTKLHMNANESLFLLRHFPLICFNMIPTVDPVYQYILETIDVIDMCFSPKFNTESIRILKEKIRQHRTKYMVIFNTHLKPKDHNMLHYDLCIEENGPLRGLSTIRAESKHQEIRAYSRNCKSRQNICYSSAKKMAFSFSKFLFDNKGGISRNVQSFKKKESQTIEDLEIRALIINYGYDIDNFKPCE